MLFCPARRRVRYTVAAGDTLSGIAAGLAVRGGWPALYAANRQAIGPDPDIIRPGTVLTIPRPARRHRPRQAPATSGTRHRRRPRQPRHRTTPGR